MSDKVEITNLPQSPQQVALELTKIVLNTISTNNINQEKIIETYINCYSAVYHKPPLK